MMQKLCKFLMIMALFSTICSCNRYDRNEQFYSFIDIHSSWLEKTIKPQIIKVPVKDVIKITSKQGTIIEINSETLDLQHPVDSIEVGLFTKNDFVKHNVPTTSNGALLVSQGMIYLKVLSNNKSVNLKPGKTAKILLPSNDVDSSQVFYAERNSQNQVDWVPSQQIVIKDSTPNFILPDDRLIEQVGRREATRIVNQLGPETADSIDQFYAYNYFYPLTIKQFGFINVDYFYKLDRSTVTLRYLIEFPDSIRTGVVYLVFKDLNSVMTDFIYPVDSSNVFNDLPIGEKVVILANYQNSKQMYFFLDSMIIGEKSTLRINFEAISESKYMQVIESL